ncbi:MAG: nucleotidyltransferase domain-containing protein [Anaerolineales bacterium]|nr:nucleotidyltransferase domain-containing protein [Anaerolineales bacterium]
MTMQISNVLDQMVERLVSQLNPLAIYLFGSQARSEANIDSDIDLLVILPESNLPRFKRESMAYDALWGMTFPADIVVLTAAEFEQSKQVATSLAATAIREGNLLYA